MKSQKVLIFSSILLASTLVGFGEKKTESTSSALSPGANSSSSASIWIARPDGAQSCSPKSGQSVEEGADDLKKAGVAVLESQKGTDGKMHMQVCGVPAGKTNSYRIGRSDLEKALVLGFKEIH